MQHQTTQPLDNSGTDRPAPDALIDLAQIYMSLGLLGGATQLLDRSVTAGGSRARAEECQQVVMDAQACDAALKSASLAADEFGVPSAERLPDGSPRFIIPIPAEAAGQAEVMNAIVSEVNGSGVDAELRSFLTAMLEPGDAFIDCDPGFGFAALSAATRHVGATSVIVRSADDGHAAFLRRAFIVNRVARGMVESPVGQMPQSIDALIAIATALQPSRMIIHAGQAVDVLGMLPQLERHLRDSRIAAIVWAPDAEQSPELQKQFARLGVSPFAIAQDANGAVLVPAGQISGASIVIGIPAHVIAGRQAA